MKVGHEMEIRQGLYNGYGVFLDGEWIEFTYKTETKEESYIDIYDVKNHKLLERVVSEYKIGNVNSVAVKGFKPEDICYLIHRDGKDTVDEYASRIIGREVWNDKSRAETEYKIYSGIAVDDYEWKNNDFKPIEPKDMIMYKLHMRGYTMQHGLNRWDKGNYKGIIKCLDEMVDLGVTSIEFQPLYEFEEIELVETSVMDKNFKIQTVVEDIDKTNYWGYSNGNYFAPKASYFGGQNASYNMKYMIDEMHGRGLEVIMEMAFDNTIDEELQIQSMIHWVKNYRIDGIHVLGNELPIDKISTNPYLSELKIFHHEYPFELLVREKGDKHLFISNDEFLYALRGLQNHFDGSISELTNNLKRQNDKFGFVNYAANSSGFTLYDSFSYGEKHNEDNGEDNRDGNNFNFSNNYGVEGKTNNKYINTIRLNNAKTAIAAVLLGQSIPLILAGDEIGNSQKGNNNIYCQDNPVGWINFSKNKFATELREFTKTMIQFRKDNPVIRLEEPMHMNDYHHTGMPDLSYHGREPWMMGIGNEKKAIGVLYAGEYSLDDNKDHVMVCYNFHYDEESFALPRMRGNKKWYKTCNTITGFNELEYVEGQQYISVPGGSITILVGKDTKITKDKIEIIKEKK